MRNPAKLVFLGVMEESRAERALARLDAALARIAAVRGNVSEKSADGAASARIMTLVNSHEKLREEVADALGDLDSLIDELEGSGGA